MAETLETSVGTQGASHEKGPQVSDRCPVVCHHHLDDGGWTAAGVGAAVRPAGGRKQILHGVAPPPMGRHSSLFRLFLFGAAGIASMAELDLDQPGRQELCGRLLEECSSGIMRCLAGHHLCSLAAGPILAGKTGGGSLLEGREPHGGFGFAAACSLSGGGLLTLEDLPTDADGDFGYGDAFAGVGHGFFHHSGQG